MPAGLLEGVATNPSLEILLSNTPEGCETGREVSHFLPSLAALHSTMPRLIFVLALSALGAFFASASTETSAALSSLATKLSSLSPQDAERLLAELGEDVAPAMDSSGSATSRSARTTCVTEVIDEGHAAAASFLEVGSETMTRETGGGLPTDLDCQCAPSACECDKTCFCRVRTDGYQGHKILPPADLEPLSAMPPDHDCACNIGEVGGPGLGTVFQNTIDCDCATAQCGCTRKCKCKRKAE